MTGPELSVLAVCDGDPRRRPGAGPGLQARRRRRRRPQHRRHGRVLAGAGRRRRPRRRRARPLRRADAGRAAATGHRLPRRALRRADAHARRARSCSSTTSASATPRPRSCCPGSTATSPSCWRRRPTATCGGAEPTFVDDAAVCVVLRRRGLPRRAPHRRRHRGPRRGAPRVPGVTVFCAGVGRRRRRRLVTAGGRVLDVVGAGPDARRRPGAGLRRRRPHPWPGMHYRTDIAEEAAATRDLKVAVLMGSPERPREDAAGGRDARALRHRGRRAGAVGPPQRRRRSPRSRRRRASDGYAAFICGAGMAAHLAGAVARNTTLPVVGRAAVGWRPQRRRRAVRHGADAQGHPGGHRRDRRRDERRAARRADAGDHRRGAGRAPLDEHRAPSSRRRMSTKRVQLAEARQPSRGRLDRRPSATVAAAGGHRPCSCRACGSRFALRRRFWPAPAERCGRRAAVTGAALGRTPAAADGARACRTAASWLRTSTRGSRRRTRSRSARRASIGQLEEVPVAASVPSRLPVGTR